MSARFGKVLVAVVEVAEIVPPTISPATESVAYGEEVPIPN